MLLLGLIPGYNLLNGIPVDIDPFHTWKPILLLLFESENSFDLSSKNWVKLILAKECALGNH